MVEILIDFVLKNIDESQPQEQQLLERQYILKSWINQACKGEEGFTAMHFASFHGNMPVIELLMKNGANQYAHNKQEINMLHVASQGDQPISLYYFIKKGLDVNSGDKKSSTPLHWASFAGAELSLSYLLSWGASVNAQDSKGLTPLHLAVKSAEDLRSTKSIKLLLLKGAEKNIKVLFGFLINLGSLRQKASGLA